MRSKILTAEVLFLRDEFFKLTELQREVFLDLVDPQPEPKPVKPQKKSSKKGAGKSTRASGMAAQLNKQLSNRAQSLAQPPATAAIDEDGDSTGTRCQFIQRYDGKLCLLLPDHNIHHLATHPEYHEFQPAGQAAATGGD